MDFLSEIIINFESNKFYKMKKILLGTFTFILGITVAYSQIQTKPITAISQKELKDVILVDVRTPEEFNAGHLPSAININWYDADFTEQFSKIDKTKTIYFYCKVGGRSIKAADRLHSLGYKNVVNLEGGYDAWVKNQ